MGVSALLAASKIAYRALTLAGASYMIWPGASLLWKSRRRGAGGAGLAAADCTNLLNPKVAVFWFTLLILATGFASRWLKGPRTVSIIDRITGTVPVGFGLKLALEPGH